MTKLTVLSVKNAKPGRHADGQGLYLLVRPGGSRSWVLRLQVENKRRDFGLGSASLVSLAHARKLAADMRLQVLENKFNGRQTIAPKDIPSFREAAKACHLSIRDGWSNEHHKDSWIASLDQHIFPSFGEVRVDRVTPAMVRNALAPIWLKIPETARRTLQRIRTVLDYAHIMEWCQHEASLRSVPKALPRQPTRENHYVSMPFVDVPTLMSTLADQPSSAGRDALILTILTAARSGETRKAVWNEFDLENGTWSVPAERMKMKRPHLVPLSAAAMAVLKRRWAVRFSNDGYVFTTHGTKPISDMTMTKILRDLGDKKTTVHGFRSSFTDWAAEKTNYRKEVVDKALAHKLVDRVEAAYRRTDFFERRRQLMVDWADYLTGAAVEMDLAEIEA